MELVVRDVHRNRAHLLVHAWVVDIAVDRDSDRECSEDLDEAEVEQVVLLFLLRVLLEIDLLGDQVTEVPLGDHGLDFGYVLPDHLHQRLGHRHCGRVRLVAPVFGKGVLLDDPLGPDLVEENLLAERDPLDNAVKPGDRRFVGLRPLGVRALLVDLLHVLRDQILDGHHLLVH